MKNLRLIIYSRDREGNESNPPVGIHADGRSDRVVPGLPATLPYNTGYMPLPVQMFRLGVQTATKPLKQVVAVRRPSSTRMDMALAGASGCPREKWWPVATAILVNAVRLETAFGGQFGPAVASDEHLAVYRRWDPGRLRVDFAATSV